MSEKAVGYTTIGGDLEGALSVIANVPKTVVIALLERLARRFGFKGIETTLATEPGPELADAQTAENELMPFPSPRRLPAPLRQRKDVAGRDRAGARGLFPTLSEQQSRAWATRFTKLFTTLNLQVGAVTAVLARRLARSGARTRAPDAGGAKDRVGDRSQKTGGIEGREGASITAPSRATVTFSRRALLCDSRRRSRAPARSPSRSKAAATSPPIVPPSTQTTRWPRALAPTARRASGTGD